MSVRHVLFALVIIVFSAATGFSQGFAGLGRDATGFQQATPGYNFEFPKDHGPHPNFQIEWWYLTANLTDADGRDLGLQWTLFRSAAAPHESDGWDSPQFWMGHAAVTTPAAHYVSERLARGGIGQAGVTPQPFHAWIDNWEMTGDTMDQLRVSAFGNDFAYEIELTAQGPLVLHGDNGFSQKSANGRASYYYAQPFYEVSGRLRLPEGDIPVTGNAWLDREWASQLLDESQVSWDWFSMVFDSGERLMTAQVHSEQGDVYSLTSWIAPDGTTTPLPNGALIATPLAETKIADRSLPTSWRVQVSEKGVDVRVEAVNPRAWMTTSVPYWEGPVRITGSHGGRGYLEMTGY